MNRNLIKVSMLVVSASALFIAGCGPEGMNDAFAQPDDSGIASKETGNMAAPQGRPAMMRQDNQAGSAMPDGDQAAPAPQDGGCPTGNCEVPPNPDTNSNVQLPDQVISEPVKITPTSERQIAIDTVNYHTNRYINQPHQRQHTVEQHRRRINIYTQTDHYLPSTSRVNIVFSTGSVEEQVMPVRTVVAPVMDNGCGGVAAAPACGAY